MRRDGLACGHRGTRLLEGMRREERGGGAVGAGLIALWVFMGMTAGNLE